MTAFNPWSLAARLLLYRLVRSVCSGAKKMRTKLSNMTSKFQFFHFENVFTGAVKFHLYGAACVHAVWIWGGGGLAWRPAPNVLIPRERRWMVQEGSRSTGRIHQDGNKVFSLSHLMGSEEKSCSLIYSPPLPLFIITRSIRKLSFSLILQLDI